MFICYEQNMTLLNIGNTQSVYTEIQINKLDLYRSTDQQIR
jgi:hypothetical protein